MTKAFTLLLLLTASASQAQKVIECDQYAIEGNTKTDRSTFHFSIAPDKASITYTLISGRELFLPSKSRLQVVWISKDGLRVVAHWMPNDYGINQARWSPVYVVDLDFSLPNYRQQSYGGFADFSEVVSSPWKYECKRLD